MPQLELDSLIRDFLAANRGPGYGVSIVAASSDLAVIDVQLRFVTGQTYCCAEPGCHLPRDASRLIRFAAERSIFLPQSLTIRWHCTVEEGTRLECLKQRNVPLESASYAFDYTTRDRKGGRVTN